MIGHLKNKINCICFINTNVHLVRNYFEKVTLDRDEVPSQCLQVEIANTSQTPFTKKGLTTQGNLVSLQGKTTMSDDFELGEDEMKPASSVNFSK